MFKFLNKWSQMHIILPHRHLADLVVFIDCQYLQRHFLHKVHLHHHVLELFITERQIFVGCFEDTVADIGLNCYGLFKCIDEQLGAIGGDGQILEVFGPPDTADIGISTLDDMLWLTGIWFKDNDLSLISPNSHLIHLLLLTISTIHHHHILPQHSSRIANRQLLDIICYFVLRLRQKKERIMLTDLLNGVCF